MGEGPPGYRRRLVATPSAARVTAALEDDYHCMAVTLHHADGVVTRVEPVLERAPWSTCPGAAATLEATFTGVALEAVAARGAKQANCTHLHDLTLLAAAHAGDATPTTWDIFAADAVDGVVMAEVLRNGIVLHRIAHRDDVLVAPDELAGTSLFKLRDWIAGLEGGAREAARLLQWGTIIAHGRAIPLSRQSDATRMPPNCFTFQPGMREQARRVGRIIDFTAAGAPEPLDHRRGAGFDVR